MISISSFQPHLFCEECGIPVGISVHQEREPYNALKHSKGMQI